MSTTFIIDIFEVTFIFEPLYLLSDLFIKSMLYYVRTWVSRDIFQNYLWQTCRKDNKIGSNPLKSHIANSTIHI